MRIGIDKIGFTSSQYVLNMKDLAEARGEDPQKFSKGLLLNALSIAPITDDVVTLAAGSANEILTAEDKEKIDMVILATESSVDQSKAGAVYVHSLLGIQPFARSFEMKEACYSATAVSYTHLDVYKRQGLLDVRARFFRPNSVLIKLDLPTLERPARAISGKSS